MTPDSPTEPTPDAESPPSPPEAGPGEPEAPAAEAPAAEAPAAEAQAAEAQAGWGPLASRGLTGEGTPAQPDDDYQREEAATAPPPFLARVRCVLLAPFQTFPLVRPDWGFLAPWFLVWALGVGVGALTLATVDLEAATLAELDRAMEGQPQQSAEQMETPRKFAVFFAKTSQIAGPPLAELAALLFTAALLFGASRALPRRTPDGELPDLPSLVTCLCLAAFVNLVHGLDYLIHGLAVLLGNPLPATSPAHLVDPHHSPALAAALRRMNPFTLYWYLLLAAALTAATRLQRRGALLASGLLLALISLGAVGMTAAGAKMQGKGGGDQASSKDQSSGARVKVQ
jgi:Yip1 domain